MRLSTNDRCVLEALQSRPMRFDVLVDASQVDRATLKDVLKKLSPNGFVQKSLSGKYSITDAGSNALNH